MHERFSKLDADERFTDDDPFLGPFPRQPPGCGCLGVLAVLVLFLTMVLA